MPQPKRYTAGLNRKDKKKQMRSLNRSRKAYKTKKGKDYWIVEVIDSNNEVTRIRCWGVKPDRDKIQLNRPYMAKLDYDENWGFSTFALWRTFKLLG